MNTVSTNTSPEIINRIVDVIALSQHPEKIYLFGSCVRGTVMPHSDIDLLVVKRTDEKKSKRAIPIYRALCDSDITGAAVDLFVLTPEEVESDKNNPYSFVYEILHNGKLMYGKQSGR